MAKKDKKKTKQSTTTVKANKPRTLREAFKVKTVNLQPIRGDGIGLEEKRGLLGTPVLDPNPLSVTLLKQITAEEKFAELLPPEATEEQRNLLAAAAAADPIMKKTEMRQLIGSMIAFRQAYATAYRELQEQLAAEGEGLHPMVEDMIIQSSMYHSSKPFNEHELMQGIIETVLPWVADVIDKHSKIDMDEDKKAKIAEAEARAATPIPLGFKHSLPQEDTVLERHRPLVLVGWQPALLWLLDQITIHVMLAKKPAFMLLRFMEFAPKAGSGSHLIRLPISKWEGCCNTNKALARTMGEHVAQQLTYEPDLLICDNMVKAYTAGFFGRPDGAAAGDANKHFSAWCKLAGCGFVGGIPTQGMERPDTSGGEYEQLRTFAYLRSLAVVEEGEGLAPDHYRISLNDGIAVFDVEKSKLDHYGKPTIIVPGDGIQL